MKSRTVLASGFVALLAAAVVFGQGRFDNVVVSATPVGGKVSMLTGSGGNIGVSVGRDGVLMIDDQFAELAPKIEAALEGLSEEAPRFLINTHWHGDHTGGNGHFAKTALIVAHDNVRRRLAGDPTIAGRVETSGLNRASLPTVTYAEGVTLHFNDEAVRVMHFPAAHTDGDSAVWFQDSKVVHMGDLYFQSGYPFIDTDSGGSIQGLLAALEAVIDAVPDDVRLIPGHGAVTGIPGLREYREMLVEITARVQEALDGGSSVREIVELGLSGDYDERWGGGFIPPERIVRTIASSLTAK